MNAKNGANIAEFFRGTGSGNWFYFTREDEFRTIGRVAEDDVDNWRIASCLGQCAKTVERMILRQREKQGL